MKVIGITSTAILSLILGIAAPAYAQQEGHGEKEDHQQENKQEHGKPEQKQTQEKGQGEHKQQQPSKEQQQPAQAQRQPQAQHKNEGEQNKQGQVQRQQKPDEKKQQPQRAEQQQRQDQNKQQAHDQQQQQAQHAQSHPPRQVSPEQHRVQQTAWQQHRSERWESDHRTWQQRGGYNGYRIPEDRFRGSFGPDHGFRIYGRPFLVVGGFPRFQYRGYWFSLVDPWPQTWANNWYDTDDVYVSYVDNGYYLFNRSHTDVGIAISISL